MSIELWARAKGEKYFGDIIRICRSFEEPEPLPKGVEDEYLDMVIEKPHKRATEKDGVEIDQREVKRTLDAIREEMSFRA